MALPARMATAQIGPFRILEQLGEGGMAIVYRAQRIGVDGFPRDVVLKAMLPQLVRNVTLVQMFEAEARLTAQLRHPNIVCVEDFGVDGDTPYLIMEFLDGKNLSQVRSFMKKARRTMPVGVAVAIVRDLCSALGFAHDFVDNVGNRMQVIHRDVSPSNVMLQRDGSVKLLDFGVAKLSNIAGQAVTTSLKGKFAYMSPEQVNQQPIDRRCDVFAAGIVLHELLVGERLFGVKDERETMRRVAAAKVTAPSLRNREVTSALDAVVLRALALSREDRYDSGTEMAAALEELGLCASRSEMADFLGRLGVEDATTSPQMKRSELFHDGKTQEDVLADSTDPNAQAASGKLHLLSGEYTGVPTETTTPSVAYSGEIEILDSAPIVAPAPNERSVSAVALPPQPAPAEVQNPFEDLVATDIFRRERHPIATRPAPIAVAPATPAIEPSVASRTPVSRSNTDVVPPIAKTTKRGPSKLLFVALGLLVVAGSTLLTIKLNARRLRSGPSPTAAALPKAEIAQPEHVVSELAAPTPVQPTLRPIPETTTPFEPQVGAPKETATTHAAAPPHSKTHHGSAPTRATGHTVKEGRIVDPFDSSDASK